VSSTARPGRLTAIDRVLGDLPRAFWRLWLATGASNLADGIVWLMIPVLAVQLGAGPGELALVTIAERGPMLVLGLVAGGLADRHDRRRTMLAVQLLRVVAALALLAVAFAGTLSIPVLILAALLLGTGEVFFDTNAQALVANLVSPGHLVRANARLDAVTRLANTLVGPPLGGLLLAVSVVLALTVSVGAFAFAAAMLLVIPGAFMPAVAGPRRHLAVEIREGLSFLRRNPLLRTLSSMTALQHAGLAAVFTLLPLYALAPGPVGLSPAGFGLLLAAWGAGALAGAALAGTLVDRVGRAGTLLGATLVAGLALVVAAATAAAPVVFAAYLVAGGGISTWGAVNVSVRQLATPDGLRGRVNATHRTMSFAAGVTGAAAAGLLGGWVGIAPVLAGGGVVVLLGLLGSGTVTRGLAEGPGAIV
jgi:MFS family permease